MIELDENRLLKLTRQLRETVQDLQEQYAELQRYISSLDEHNRSFDEVLRSNIVTRFLSLLTGSSELTGGESPGGGYSGGSRDEAGCEDKALVFTMLLPANQDGNFALLPGGFSQGWHQKHGKLLETFSGSGTVLSSEKGIAWCGATLFKHRPYCFSCPRWFTPCSASYRDITAAEFLVKALTNDVCRLVFEGPSGSGDTFEQIGQWWTDQVKCHWDGFRVPDILLDKKKEEYNLFAVVDRESVELAIGRSHEQGKRKDADGNKRDEPVKLSAGLDTALDKVFKHYKNAFFSLSAQSAEQLLKRGNGKKTGNSLERLVETTASVIKDIYEALEENERDTFRIGIQKLDVRSGPLSWALHLQNLRVMPVSVVTNLAGLAVSQVRYTGLHTLEAVLAEQLPGQESVLDVIHEEILRPFFCDCLRKLLDERREAAAEQTISGQREIIMDDSVRLFRRVSPGAISGRDLFKEYPVILGRSLPMQEVYRRIRKVAPTQEPVLILGETGTGKELAAQAVQRLSRRPNETFVVLNSAAIPDDLIESELFGHEKGAFTGATARKRGKFEQADGGTLFLDEIGDMSLRTQARILRVIQEQTFERVGGDVTYKVDVRLLTATHKNLPELISEGCFRDDLLYRLNVYPIVLPPLRERPEDIPLLAIHFILEKQESMPGIEVKELSSEALKLLMEYPWPGNVRQLRNVIGSVMVDLVGEDRETIEREDLEKALKPLAEYRREIESPAQSVSGTERASTVEQRISRMPGPSVSSGMASRLPGAPSVPIGAAAVSSPSAAGQPASAGRLPLGRVDADHEVSCWMDRFNAGEKLSDHKLIFRSYGEEDGMMIYLELFEAGKKRYGTCKNFAEHIGVGKQYSAIRNKLLTFRRKIEERGESGD